MVTNPGTRDWTVTASLFATLNEMYGNRTVCGIGRGDSAVRVTERRAGHAWPTLREAIHVIRELGNGREVEYKGSTLQFPWGQGSAARGVGGRLRAEGARADRRGGRRVHPAARRPRHRRVDVGAVREAAAAAGRDPDAVTICVAAPAYVGDDLAHARDQCRWFGGMVGNHVADLVARYGDTGAVPARRSPTTSRAAQGYDYNEHGRAGNTAHRLRARRDHRPVLPPRPVEAHIERLQRARGARRRPVRRLPPARRQGVDPRGLRRAHHPRGARAGHRQALTVPGQLATWTSTTSPSGAPWTRIGSARWASASTADWCRFARPAWAMTMRVVPSVRLLAPPRGLHPTVDEHVPDPVSVGRVQLRREAAGDPAPIGVGEQDVVVLREEPHRRRHVRVGDRPVGDVEQLAPGLVGPGAELRIRGARRPRGAG